jgi:hypothetical protein
MNLTPAPSFIHYYWLEYIPQSLFPSWNALVRGTEHVMVYKKQLEQAP